MPATITSIAPASANPGDVITITGTGFADGAAVSFAGAVTLADPAPTVVSPTQITATVPDFGGDAVALRVTVANPEPDTSSNAWPLQLKAWPPIAGIIPLCGLNALKRSLGLTVAESDEDDHFRQLILDASAQLTRIVDYDLQPVTIEGELYDGEGGAELYLRHAPIQSVAALSIDGQVVDVSTVKVYPEYIAFDDSGDWNPRLRSWGQMFGCGRQNVSVTYTAGFAQIPADLARACILQVAFLQNTLGKQGLISDTNQQVNATTQYSQLPLAPAARITANRYRKTGVKVV